MLYQTGTLGEQIAECVVHKGLEASDNVGIVVVAIVFSSHSYMIAQMIANHQQLLVAEHKHIAAAVLGQLHLKHVLGLELNDAERFDDVSVDRVVVVVVLVE
jgi:hypothetical protein